MLDSARSWRTLRLLPTLLLLTIPACSHSDSFSPHDTSTNGPLVAGTPVRLTYNPQQDVEPSWLPDGTAIIYAFGVTDLRQSDQCLGVMAAAGGTLMREICNHGTFAVDSTDVFSWPAVDASDQLAYFHAAAPLGGNPGIGRLVVAPLATPDSTTTLATFPMQGASAFYVQPAFVRWLGNGRLVFLGLVDTPAQPCGSCNVLVRSGHDIFVADLSTAPATLAVVPGTLYATSVAAVPGNPDLIYYTLAGDSRILSRALAAGAVSTVHDFGPGVIVRDLSVGANRLAAIVGGRVDVIVDAGRPLQTDGGGHLVVVDAATGTETELSAGLTFFRHPAVSPDGAAVVAEGYPYAVTPIVGPTGNVIGSDTTIAPVGDLLKFAAP